MDLSFLGNVTVAAAPVIKAKGIPANRKKERQPLGDNEIRLFTDGSVYPSQNLITLLNLEYGKRDENNEPTGYGFDVIDSRDMTNQLTGLGPNDAFVGLALVARKEGKLDLFARTTYETNGDPASTVATQGSSTYGKEELIPLLQQVYGPEFQFNELGYCDLEISTEHKFTSPDDRFFVYKRISRGPSKGKKDYAVRVGVSIQPLVPVIQLGATSDSDAAIATTAGTAKSAKTIRPLDETLVDANSGDSAMGDDLAGN